MKKKPLSPTNDYVFKRIFTDNKYSLSNFLHAVLVLDPEEFLKMEVADPALVPNSPEEKRSILDIKIITKSDKVINIEVQVQKQDFIWKRVQYYSARLLSEQATKGSRYSQLPQAITILVTNFLLIDDDIAHHSFRLFDEKNKVRFQDSSQIDILELPKAKKMEQSELSSWLLFLGGKTEEDFEMAAQSNPAVKEAWDFLKILSADETARAYAKARDKELMDIRSAKEEGKAEGKAEGRAEEKAEMVLNLLRLNIPLDAITSASGLTIEAVEALASKIDQPAKKPKASKSPKK